MDVGIGFSGVIRLISTTLQNHGSSEVLLIGPPGDDAFGTQVLLLARQRERGRDTCVNWLPVAWP